MQKTQNKTKTHTHILYLPRSFSLDAISNLHHHHLLLVAAATDCDNNTTKMDPTTTNDNDDNNDNNVNIPNNNINNFPPINNILEISLISAQDLAPILKSLRTYAVTWINPNKKKTTRIDNEDHNNPTWNDKFSFKVFHVIYIYIYIIWVRNSNERIE